MKKIECPTGTVSGRLTTISEPVSIPKVGRFVLCRCECGNEKRVQVGQLVSGHVRSCGCLMKDVSAASGRRNKTHGNARDAHETPEYSAWLNMKARCKYATLPCHKDYGARGIAVCERWMSFENFLSDMGARPSSKHTLDRIDNDKGYSPENCRWATRKEQARNRRNTLMVSLGGSMVPLAEVADARGISYERLRRLIVDKKMDIEDALLKIERVEVPR